VVLGPRSARPTFYRGQCDCNNLHRGDLLIVSATCRECDERVFDWKRSMFLNRAALSILFDAFHRLESIS
jgi:hypothetical protein